MTTNVASSINLSSLGLGSGLNDASIISQLVAIESAPLGNLQSSATTVSSASTTLAAFSTSMKTLASAAQALADPTQFNVFSATSSATQVVASTSPGATAGSHTVSVTQVAQAQITYSNPEASSSGALGQSGTLGLTVGGKPYNITVGTSDSLASIAASIASSGAPVTASVVYDGSQYRLDIQGNQTGAANAISFSEAGTSLGLAVPANTFQAAQDTHAVIDGISVSSATTQISGAIPGVSLAVTGVTTGASSVSVSASSGSLATSLQTFVTAYNAVLTGGHAAIGYGATAASNSMLAGDPGIRSSLDQLSGLIAGSVGGSDPTLTTLGSIGLDLNADGTITLNSATLTSAVQTDSAGVEKLLVTSASQGMTGVMGTIASTIASLATNSGGVLLSEAQYFTNQSSQIAKNETAMQARITAYQTQLQTEFSNADQTVNTERSLFSDVGGTGTFM